MGVRGAIDTDDVALTTIIDSTTTAGYTYVCEAPPGTASSAAGWRISRITGSSGSVYYAGSGEFNQVADNRASLTYA